MRANRIPRVPHSCLKLNFVLTFVLMFVVFTYAILGSGGGDHSGETWGSCPWRTSGYPGPVVDIYFFDGIFFCLWRTWGIFFPFCLWRTKGQSAGRLALGQAQGGMQAMRLRIRRGSGRAGRGRAAAPPGMAFLITPFFTKAFISIRRAPRR